MCDSEHQSDVMYDNYSVYERDWEQGVDFNLLGASSIPRFVTLASMVEFSPGIHDGMIEFVESHSLELMKKADELPLIRSNIVSMHDLLSCHLHTLTPSHIGLDQLCWHNFENNRHLQELGVMLE